MAWTRTPMANVIKALNAAVEKLVQAETNTLTTTATRVEALAKNLNHRKTLRLPLPPVRARR